MILFLKYIKKEITTHNAHNKTEKILLKFRGPPKKYI